MPQFKRLRKPALLAGLMLLGGAGVAQATQCSSGQGPSLLQSSFQAFGNSQGCGDTSQDHPGGPPGLPGPDFGIHFDRDGKRWEGWHDHKWYKDGKECNPPVVPLPASSWLLVSGAVAMLAMGRRRRAAA